MSITAARTYNISVFIIIALTVIYLANCFTPVRLTNDTVRYLKIKEWLEAGRPEGDAAGQDFLPYGYIWFLLLLEKLHLAKSLVISFIHLLYLLGSVWFVTKIFGSSFKLWQLLALALLNWAAMKFVITPLSEMQFLFFSMGTLYFYHQFEKKGKGIYLLWAFVFCLVAMVTRTAGFMLLLSILVTVFLKKRKAFISLLKTSRWTIVGLLVGIVVFVLLFNKFNITDYVRDHRYSFRPILRDPLLLIKNNLRNHFIDFAALSLNSPSSKLSFGVSQQLVQMGFLVAGIITFVWIFYLAFRKSNTVPLLIKVYMSGYSALVLAWPFFEPRFWVPAMLLFIAVILQEQKSKLILFTAYKWLYVIVGLAALSYYTYTSFNKREFAVKQDAGKWRNEYETYFFGRPLRDSAVVSEPILKLIKKYD